MENNHEERAQQPENPTEAQPETVSEAPAAKRSKKRIVYWTLIGIFAAIFLVSGTMVVDYMIKQWRHDQMIDQLPTYNTDSRPIPTAPPATTLLPTTGRPTQSPTTGPIATQPTTVPTVPTEPPAPTEPVMLEAIIPFFEINQDVIGYIHIPDTKISYPVLQRKADKDYYLYKDIHGNYDVCGSIYVREACDVFQPSDNVTIYGHHMASGKMFANVMNYAWSRDFFDSHPYVYFDTLYEEHIYQVVCVFKTSGTYGVGFPYHLYDDFTNEDEFWEFVNGVRSRAIHDSGIEVKYGDKFICLSTCEYTIENGRMVLVAVRVS